jgi:hypothetical protein
MFVYADVTMGFAFKYVVIRPASSVDAPNCMATLLSTSPVSES